jgi:hypothetical protein
MKKFKSISYNTMGKNSVHFPSEGLKSSHEYDREHISSASSLGRSRAVV